MLFPRYRPATRGGWSIQLTTLAAARGYWGETYGTQETAILTGPGTNGAASWMSILPSEIESQQIGLAAARGHTVIFGLGMGWLAANVAMQEAVDRVTVVEQDPDVMAIVDAAGAFDELPDGARDKLRIVRGDAREWRPEAPVQSLQADIWLRFSEDGKLADVRRMQSNVGAESLYFWGQEMEIWRHACRRAGGVPETLDWATVRAIVSEDLRLPLVMPDWDDYPGKIVAAAQWWSPSDAEWWRRD